MKSNGQFEITKNGIDTSSDKMNGMILSYGEFFTVRAEFPNPTILDEKFSAYNLSAILTVVDSEGEQKELTVTPVCYAPNPSGFWDVLQYVFVERSERSEK